MTTEAAREKLKRLMKKHKLTCPKVAEMTGCKTQTVRTWRSGRYPVPAYALKILELSFDR
jgi:DNA-binding transcriptional regulator YiaG